MLQGRQGHREGFKGSLGRRDTFRTFKGSLVPFPGKRPARRPYAFNARADGISPTLGKTAHAALGGGFAKILSQRLPPYEQYTGRWPSDKRRNQNPGKAFSRARSPCSLLGSADIISYLFGVQQHAQE